VVFAVTTLGILGAILFEALAPQINWPLIFGVQSKAAAVEILPTTRFLVYIFMLGIGATIIQRTYSALQDAYSISLIQLVMRIASGGLVAICVKFELGLPELVVATLAPTYLGSILIGLPLLLKRYKWLRFSNVRMDFNIDILKDTMRVGGVALLASLAYFLVVNSITAVISLKYGSAAVATYAVFTKLTSLPVVVLTYLLTPLWPAITEANGSGDSSWIVKTYSHGTLLTIGVGSICFIILLLFGRKIVFLWTGSDLLIPETGVLLASLAFMAVGLWNVLLSVILNGLSRFRSQASIGLTFALLSIGVAILLPSGLDKSSVIWVITIGYFFRCACLQRESSRLIEGLIANSIRRLPAI